jgi:hypothetical protein
MTRARSKHNKVLSTTADRHVQQMTEASLALWSRMRCGIWSSCAGLMMHDSDPVQPTSSLSSRPSSVKIQKVHLCRGMRLAAQTQANRPLHRPLAVIRQGGNETVIAGRVCVCLCSSRLRNSGTVLCGHEGCIKQADWILALVR